MAEQRITASYSSRYTFTGKEQDALTGLHYFGARYYDARISLWYGVDPLAEQMPNHSAYNYVYNNPIRFTDQYGLYGEEGEATKAQETAVAKYGKDRVGDVYFNKDKKEYAFQIYGEGKDKYEHNNNEGTVAYRPDISVYDNKQYDNYLSTSNSDQNKSNSQNGNFEIPSYVGPLLFVAGQPIKSLKPIGMLGSKPGSSIASYAFRNIPGTLKGTLGNSLGGTLARIAGTNGLGAATGRFVPFLGLTLMANDFTKNIALPMSQGMQKYNSANSNNWIARLPH
jgi:RHS repeat-associated protein